MSQKPRDKHQHGGHPQKPSGTHNNSPEELAAINKTLIAFSEKYDEGKEKNPGREHTRFIVEVCVAVGVGIYTLITAGLLAASLIQLKIMQDTEHRQLRAYVGMAPGDVEDFGVAAKQRIKFIRKNFGGTPAYNVGFSNVGFSIIKPGSNINTGVSDCVSPKIAGQITMFPTVELPWTVTIDPKLFPSERLQLVKAGDEQFVYWGTACYHDAFGVPHFTNYCWMYKGSNMTAKDAEACLTHNDSN